MQNYIKMSKKGASLVLIISGPAIDQPWWSSNGPAIVDQGPACLSEPIAQLTHPSSATCDIGKKEFLLIMYIH